jgi:hypothetical protein
MPQTHWDQIHRYLTFHPAPISQNDAFFAPVGPVASVIRANCQSAIKTSTWVAVYEVMAPFTRRSKHKVNLASKPTPEGYKVWVLALQRGYTWSWPPVAIGRISRRFSQPVGMPLILLAPTYQVVQSLCQVLQDKDPTTSYYQKDSIP